MTDLVVDEDLQCHVDEWLFPETPGPPELRIVDVDVPVDPIQPGGGGANDLVDDATIDEGAQLDGALSVAIETSVETEIGAGLVGIAAQHPPGVDANRSGRLEANGSP